MKQEPSEHTLLTTAEELYALPLSDFTPARDAEAKKQKGAPDAARIRSMRKPSTAAWVVNLLVRHETAQVEELIDVGAALREAQAGMDAAQLRDLTRQRRRLTAAVTTRARGLAREHGLRVTAAVADQVEATLTAAMVEEGCALAVRSGLLVTALAATGVDEVDAASAVAVPEALGYRAAPVVPPPPEPLHAVPDLPDTAALDAATEALAAAEQSYDDAAARHAQAQTESDRLDALILQVRSEIDDLRRRLAQAEQRAGEVEDERTAATDARDRAAGALEAAARTRDEAAAEVARLTPTETPPQ